MFKCFSKETNDNIVDNPPELPQSQEIIDTDHLRQDWMEELYEAYIYGTTYPNQGVAACLAIWLPSLDERSIEAVTIKVKHFRLAPLLEASTIFNEKVPMYRSDIVVKLHNVSTVKNTPDVKYTNLSKYNRFVQSVTHASEWLGAKALDEPVKVGSYYYRPALEEVYLVGNHKEEEYLITTVAKVTRDDATAIIRDPWYDVWMLLRGQRGDFENDNE